MQADCWTNCFGHQEQLRRPTETLTRNTLDARAREASSDTSDTSDASDTSDDSSSEAQTNRGLEALLRVSRLRQVHALVRNAWMKETVTRTTTAEVGRGRTPVPQNTSRYPT